MRHRSVKSLLYAFLLCAVALSPAPAGESAVSKAADKAATQLLGSMKDCFTDLGSIEALTPQQKVDYLLNKAFSRIQDQAAKLFQKQLEEKLKDYAKKTVTAQAVKDIAIPRMLTALELGEKYDKGRVDALVASQADTNMRAITTGIDAAKVTYSVFKKTRDEGPLEGFKALSAVVSDKMAGYYIPGWGWIKTGADLTKALVSYVLSYATETAKMAMFNDMYPEFKTDPGSFAKWLLKQSDRAIGLDVKSRWDEEGVEFAQYVWEGKGTDNGAVLMRDRLRQMLFKMRDEIDRNTRAQRETQAQIDAELQKAYEDVKKAEKDLLDVARQATDEADAKQSKIEEFRQTYLGYSGATEQAQEYAQANNGQQVAARASYFEFGLKFDDLKEAIRADYLAGKLDLQQYYGRLDAEWENVNKKYLEQRGQFKTAYGGKPDASSTATLSLFNKESDEYLRLSRSEYTGTKDQAAGYVAALQDETRATEGRLKSEILKLYSINYTGEDLVRQLTGADTVPDSPDYPGIGDLNFPKNAFPAPKLHAAGNTDTVRPYFGAYSDYIEPLARETAEKAAQARAKVQFLDISVKLAAGNEERRQQLKENAAAIADMEARISQAVLPENIKNAYLNPGTNPEPDPADPDQRFRNTVFEELKTQNKNETSLLAKATMLTDKLKGKLERWQAGGESMQADAIRLQRITSLLHRGEDAITSAAALPDRKGAGAYTENCSPNSPGGYFLFKPGKEPACGQLLASPAALMNRGETQAARTGFIAGVRASGVFGLDSQYGLGIEAFVTALADDYFKDAYFPENYIFIPFENKCCFYTADYFTGETAKMKGLKAESDSAPEGTPFKGRSIENLAKTPPYEYAKACGTASLISLTESAFDPAVKQGIREFCAEFDVLKADNAAYLGRQALDIAYSAEADALSDRIAKAKTEAATRNDGESWKKVSALGTEVADFEKKYKSADISGYIKKDINAKVEGMKAMLAAAPDPNLEAVKTMYEDFRTAYEGKNESRVLKFISPDWDAGDGTGISDLSGYLRNIFTVFNEVRCVITDLSVIKKADGVYRTSYNMAITGRIFDQNIKHEEKSSVEEEVTVNGNSKPVIAKTMKGNFWYFE